MGIGRNTGGGKAEVILIIIYLMYFNMKSLIGLKCSLPMLFLVFFYSIGPGLFFCKYEPF